MRIGNQPQKIILPDEQRESEQLLRAKTIVSFTRKHFTCTCHMLFVQLNLSFRGRQTCSENEH